MKAESTHCWHRAESNNFMATYPPSVHYVCCHCGEKVTLHLVQPKGHGYYLPSSEGEWEALPVAKCKKRTRSAHPKEAQP